MRFFIKQNFYMSRGQIVHNMTASTGSMTLGEPDGVVPQKKLC
jgi:hypothetical protein